MMQSRTHLFYVWATTDILHLFLPAVIITHLCETVYEIHRCQNCWTQELLDGVDTAMLDIDDETDGDKTTEEDMGAPDTDGIIE